MTDETTNEDEGGDVVVESPLPGVGLELPDYHGQKPVGQKTTITGAGNRLTGEHVIDTRVVLVIEAKVKKAGHEQTDDGLLWVENLKTIDLFEVRGKAGTKLLSTLRSAWRESDDVGKGRTAFPEGPEGLDGVTDESGVVLTPDELAAARGVDPVAAMADGSPMPVVVVYSDGAREFWPEEFDEGDPCPVVGQRFILPEVEEPKSLDDFVFVRTLLDVDTGETVAEWTDEEEAKFLSDLEVWAEALERAADAGPPEADEGEIDDGSAFDSPPKHVYFRLIFSDGETLEEVFLDTIPKETIAEAVVIEEVLSDGTKVTVERPDDGWPADAPDLVAHASPAEIAFAGDAPDDDVEVTDDELADVIAIGGFVEDADGFAEPAPGPEHFAYVDRKASEIKDGSHITGPDGEHKGTRLPVAEIGLSGPGSDADRARLGHEFLVRAIMAEEQGRGRGLQTRKIVVDMLTKRAGELYLLMGDSPADLPADASLEVNDDEEANDGE